MIDGLDLDSDTRLLVVVPHPDDETLATGGLIQIALDAGAALRVVIATDGDNNPWPQRWVEKRWRIDAEARRRWGRRRRSEVTEALARLGVTGADIRHYGWPDQGLTGLLMRDAQCEDQLVAEIVDFAPTLVVAPSLADRHPDRTHVLRRNSPAERGRRRSTVGTRRGWPDAVRGSGNGNHRREPTRR